MTSRLRLDYLTAQRVHVGLIFQHMLGTAEARSYLLGSGVPDDVVEGVLRSGGKRDSDPSVESLRDLEENRNGHMAGEDAMRAIVRPPSLVLAEPARAPVVALGAWPVPAERQPDWNDESAGRKCRRHNYVLAACVNASLRLGSARAERLLRAEGAPEYLIDSVVSFLSAREDASPAAFRTRIGTSPDAFQAGRFFRSRQ